ncbi:hypothetical protein K435DRAFT_855296 [Dendrothele bispora CBS 962.96]|uniref:Hydrophobin n=1 Tax=Dendrothele bispora (strain CBS 962.96) TaxID=1314807 RepID=A0A4V6T5I9_DENBC|nr:hypothetical protein K435DRAFT_855296 [Dendrothele bispora CBS 962.96]
MQFKAILIFLSTISLTMAATLQERQCTGIFAACSPGSNECCFGLSCTNGSPLGESVAPLALSVALFYRTILVAQVSLARVLLGPVNKVRRSLGGATSTDKNGVP